MGQRYRDPAFHARPHIHTRTHSAPSRACACARVQCIPRHTLALTQVPLPSPHMLARARAHRSLPHAAAPRARLLAASSAGPRLVLLAQRFLWR